MTMLTSVIDNDNNKETLNKYAVLLVPFYQQNNTVPKFFDKLLQSRNDDVRLTAVTTLLKNNHPVPDSILLSMASNDQLRGKLYSELVEIKKGSTVSGQIQNTVGPCPQLPGSSKKIIPK